MQVKHVTSLFRHSALLALVCVELVLLGLELPRPWTDVVHLVIGPLAALGLYGIRRRPGEAVIFLVLSTLGSALNLIFAWGTMPLAMDLIKVTFWTLAPAYLAGRIFVAIYDADAITQEEMASAVSIYLLIGLVFANIYEALFLIDPDVLRFGSNFAEGTIGFGEVLYFSFMALSTVGFGDISPNHATTRIVSATESVVGVMYLAIMVARFVSLYTSHRMGRGR